MDLGKTFSENNAKGEAMSLLITLKREPPSGKRKVCYKVAQQVFHTTSYFPSNHLPHYLQTSSQESEAMKWKEKSKILLRMDSLGVGFASKMIAIH